MQQIIVRLTLFFFMLFLLLAHQACTVSMSKQEQNKYRRSIPNINRSVSAAIQSNPNLSQGPWPEDEWWKAYDSRELNALMQQALEQNPTLQEMRARVNKAQQEAQVIRASLSPTLMFRARSNEQYRSKNGLYRALNPNITLNAHEVDLSLVANYEFDFWGKNRNLLNAAIGQQRVQLVETQQLRLLITTSLAQTYFNYQINKRLRETYRKWIGVRKKIKDLQALLVSKGLSSLIPLDSRKIKLNQIKQRLAIIDFDIESDAYAINVLAGRPANAKLAANAALKPLPKRLRMPKDISLDLIARRPDLTAQTWRMKSLAYATGAAMADYYPNVNLVGLIGLESVAWQRLLQASSRTGALRPAIHLPIFTAGEIKANINRHKAQFDEAVFAYNQLLLTSTQQVLEVLSFIQSVYSQKNEQQHAVDAAMHRLNLSKLRVEKGLDSQFDYYFKKEKLLANQIKNIELLYQQYFSSVKLIKVLGGGYHEARA